MSNVRKIWSSRSQGKVASISFKFPGKKWSTGMRCDNLCSDTIALYGNDAFYPIRKTCKKMETDIVIFNGNVLVHAWHTWCKKDTNGKRMSCSLLMGPMQIFKLIDFRTMGLWKWITFILIHTVLSNMKIIYAKLELDTSIKNATSVVVYIRFTASSCLQLYCRDVLICHICWFKMSPYCNYFIKL